MKKLVKTIVPVGVYVLGLFTSLFIGYFQDLVTKLGILLVGVVLSLTISYYNNYKPAVDVEQKRLRNFLNTFLYPRLNQKYRVALGNLYGEELSQDEIDEIVDDVRINLMLYERRYTLLWRESRKILPWQKSLQIDFCHGDYSEAEKKIKWRPDEGCCGKALDGRDSVAADLDTSTKNAYNMTEEQQAIAGEPLGSVLSIPIYEQEKGKETFDKQPTAILNIDSEYCLEKTRLNEKKIEEPLINTAQGVGVFL